METQFRRKPPLLSSLSSIFIIWKTIYNIVLMQTHISTQASICRRLQPSLVYQLLLEGSSNPLSSRLPATPRRELQPPEHNTSFYWQEASTSILKASTLGSTADHVSSIFILDQIASTQLFININKHKFYPINQSEQ